MCIQKQYVIVASKSNQYRTQQRTKRQVKRSLRLTSGHLSGSAFAVGFVWLRKIDKGQFERSVGVGNLQRLSVTVSEMLAVREGRAQDFVASGNRLQRLL